MQAFGNRLVALTVTDEASVTQRLSVHVSGSIYPPPNRLPRSTSSIRARVVQYYPAAREASIMQASITQVSIINGRMGSAPSLELMGYWIVTVTLLLFWPDQ